MPESFYDMIVIIFYTVLPLTLILLQIYLSARQHILYGFIIPLIWSALGIWMIMRNAKQEDQFSGEILIFFLIGDIVLFAILALIRWRKSTKNKKISSKKK